MSVKVIYSQESNNNAINLRTYYAISKDDLSALIKLLGKINTMKHISSLCVQYGFPYKKHFISADKILANFELLGKYEPLYKDDIYYKVKNIKSRIRYLYEGAPLVILSTENDYGNFNIISDYFQESVRMDARRKDQVVSPNKFWQNNLDKIIEHAIIKYAEINAYTLRESLYELVYECTSFRPTIMVTFIKKFNAKCVLDFSAGWGDRLIGAMSQDVDYYFGCDPNTKLHQNYAKMIKMFGKNSEQYNMCCESFETVELPDKPFDLVLTSPPYFNLENYCNEATQSINNRSFNAWLHEFLFASLQKSYNALIQNGYIVIIINDIGNFKIVDKMLAFMQTLNVTYKGVISYASLKGNYYASPQPIWIWQKN